MLATEALEGREILLRDGRQVRSWPIPPYRIYYRKSKVTGTFPVEVYVRPAGAREKMLVPVKCLAGSGASFCQFPVVRKVLEPSRFLLAAV